jgi:GT2 family glycosyltransferase
MAPDVTIIVPAYRAERTLAGCVSSLLSQSSSFAGTFEVVVAASADHADDLPRDLPADPRVRVLEAVPRLPAAAARNRAAAAAEGKLLVFTDADVVADPGWLDALVSASSSSSGAMVAGSVVNGTPESAAGTVEYLVEFLDLHPGRPARTAWHGATCNLLVPRDLWDELGPFPEDLEGGEDTLLTGAARTRGRFVFAPAASITHLNRTRFREVFAHQVMFGRFTAHLGRRGPYKLRPLVRYTPLAPVAALGRVVSIYARVLAWAPELRRRSLIVFPLVVVTLAGWGAGLAAEGARLDAGRLRRPR